jgi:hypothetical protein
VTCKTPLQKKTPIFPQSAHNSNAGTKTPFDEKRIIGAVNERLATIFEKERKDREGSVRELRKQKPVDRTASRAKTRDER